MTETWDCARLPPAYAAHPELIWAPIRHHSPHCAWQVRRLIEAVRPDVVLIEGPSEANDLLPHLLDEQTRPPVALFIHARSPARQAAQARCFVPMAAMSPEWVALREANRLGIEAHFIDLPYMARQALLDPDAEADDELEPPLNDDRPMVRADAMATLLAVSGCADFDTWWERHFESGVVYPMAEDFFVRLLHLGHYLREGDGVDALTLAREAHMALAINRARAEGKRCLVVCGAFHCLGILAQLEAPGAFPEVAADTAGVHLVNYSLQRLNATRHYAAGIPDCAYQARVWSVLSRRRENAGEVHQEVHAGLALELVEHLRQQRLGAAFPDAVEAVVMARQLAALRGHGVGRLELREALLSSVLKQARDGSEQTLLAEIERFLAGNESGRLPAGLPVPPLVADFRQHCRRLRLPSSAGAPLERALDIYRSARHREQSHMLHRLEFLGVPYATLLAGPRFAQGQDLQRVREVWSIRWQPESEAVLTERSHYGSRLLDAATACCRERMEQARRQRREPASLLIEALAMGLHDLLGALLHQVEHWLEREGDLLELCRGLLRLDAARHARSALGGQGLEALDGLLALCFQRICLCLPWQGGLPEENHDELADALVDMLNLVTLDTPGCEPESFFEALQLMLAMQPSALLRGLVHGVLLEGRRMDVEAVADALDATAGEAFVDVEAPGRFVAGILRVARHRLLQEERLQACMGDMLLSWDEETFLQALPGLRLAFTQLSPRQLSELAGDVMPGVAARLPAASRHWSSDDLQRAAQLRSDLGAARLFWDGGRDD